MSDVAFLFTNPRHHLDMMAPVARELAKRGVTSQLISLAELRGLDTPRDHQPPIKRVIPYNIRRSPTVGTSIGHPSGKRFWVRRLAQRVVSVGLNARVHALVGKARVIVVPNDSAYPFRDLIASYRGRVPFVLVQEGIRFDFPNGDPYGRCGVSAVCAWGEGSAEHFLRNGVDPAAVKVTGTPRLDKLDPASFVEPGKQLLASLGLRKKPIAYLSNPIEQQGFCTRAERVALFERFLVEAEPFLRERDLAVIVKNHKNEDPNEYIAAAARTPARDRVHVLPDAPLFAAVSASAAGIVLTSTVGLESLVFGVPIAALEIPGHGFGFEYVSQGAAVGLQPGSIRAGLAELLDSSPSRRAAGQAFVERHLHARGSATTKVADVVGSFVR